MKSPCIPEKNKYKKLDWTVKICECKKVMKLQMYFEVFIKFAIYMNNGHVKWSMGQYWSYRCFMHPTKYVTKKNVTKVLVLYCHMNKVCHFVPTGRQLSRTSNLHILNPPIFWITNSHNHQIKTRLLNQS